MSVCLRNKFNYSVLSDLSRGQEVNTPTKVAMSVPVQCDQESGPPLTSGLTLTGPITICNV